MRVDVCVVGAGLVGLWAAHACARRGRSVVVVDRFDPGHVRGSSHGTERILRFAYTDPLYVDLTARSVPLWDALDPTVFGRVGCVDDGDPAELAELEAAMTAGGIAVQRWSRDEASARLPGMRFVGDALFQPDAGVLRVDVALERLAAGVADLGGTVVRPATVVSVEAGEQTATVVLGDDSTVEATVVVTAAGAWARTVVPEGVDLPRIAVTEEVVGYFRPSGAAAPQSCLVRRSSPGFYGLPMPDGRYKLGGHGIGPEVDPDRRDDSWRSGRALTDLSAYVAEWLPGLDPEPDGATTCLYASTPTEDPVLERAGTVVLAVGFGGHGAKFAPAAGEVVADLVDGAEGPVQLRRDGAAGPVGDASGRR